MTPTEFPRSTSLSTNGARCECSGDDTSADLCFTFLVLCRWSEALHGVANSPGVRFEDPVQFATSFPQIINMVSALLIRPCMVIQAVLSLHRAPRLTWIWLL